jgi:peroxiredoxin Q/BCP
MLLRALVGCGLVMLAACGRPPQRADGGFGLLPVGAPAPEVVGYDAQHNEVRLSAQCGHPAVVYFYPKDGTPGCTTEACAFRDAWARYQKANIAVIGVSSDSDESHRRFLADQKLPFALASDESGSIGTAYGVSKKLWGYDRVTFLIGADGKVARVWESVDPGAHADEVLAAAQGR